MLMGTNIRLASVSSLLVLTEKIISGELTNSIFSRYVGRQQPIAISLSMSNEI